MRKISISMGQYRYSGSGTMTKLQPVISNKAISMSAGSSTTNASFQDIQISPGNGATFLQNEDYYVKIKIPQDLNYSMAFDIQLTKQQGSAAEVYQFLRQVTVEQGGKGGNAYTVVLYDDLDNKTRAMIPLTYKAGTTNTRNNMYYQASTNRYYIGNGGTSYKAWDKFNDLIVMASWREEQGKNYGIFEMTFRPIDSGFTHIHLKMVRTAEDYNIQRITSSGTVEYGRKIDKDDVTCELYHLNNLVKSIIGSEKSFTRIGVWSHPGLIMMINGEEIRVTANGYYELDALPITSLGIVAPNNDYSNFFTLDYEYETDDGD